MTKGELSDWKHIPTTQEILHVFAQRRERLKDELTTMNDLNDIKFNQGYIAACNDFLDIEPEESQWQ